ncbi:hypothetical protein K7432_016957, partial [Basidiobolus ranarum]
MNLGGWNETNIYEDEIIHCGKIEKYNDYKSPIDSCLDNSKAPIQNSLVRESISKNSPSTLDKENEYSEKWCFLNQKELNKLASQPEQPVLYDPFDSSDWKNRSSYQSSQVSSYPGILSDNRVETNSCELWFEETEMTEPPTKLSNQNHADTLKYEQHQNSAMSVNQQEKKPSHSPNPFTQEIWEIKDSQGDRNNSINGESAENHFVSNNFTWLSANETEHCKFKANPKPSNLNLFQNEEPYNQYSSGKNPDRKWSIYHEKDSEPYHQNTNLAYKSRGRAKRNIRGRGFKYQKCHCIHERCNEEASF